MPGGEWTFAVAVLAALAALATLVHRIVVQLLGRIDTLSAALSAQIDARFKEAERIRAESSQMHLERFAVRDRQIADLGARLDAHQREVADNYIRRDAWIEAEGRTFLKLEKILERLGELGTHG